MFLKCQVLLEKRNSADLDGSAMKRAAKRDAPWPTKTLNYGVWRLVVRCGRIRKPGENGVLGWLHI